MSFFKKAFSGAVNFLRPHKSKQQKPRIEEEAEAYLALAGAYLRQGRHTDVVAALCTNLRWETSLGTAVMPASAAIAGFSCPEDRPAHAKTLWGYIQALAVHHRAQILSGDFTAGLLCQHADASDVWSTVERFNRFEKSDVFSASYAVYGFVTLPDHAQSTARAAHIISFIMNAPQATQARILSAPGALLSLSRFDTQAHLAGLIAETFTFKQQCAVIDQLNDNERRAKEFDLRAVGYAPLAQSILQADKLPAPDRAAAPWKRDPRLN